MAMMDYALLYREKLNWSIIPSTTTSRSPFVGWTEYQSKLPTIEKIREWWTKFPDANISLVCGKLSGVVVWDADGSKAIEYMKQKGLYNTLTVQSSESDRLHYYFKYPDFKDDRQIRSKNLRKSHLEIPLEYKGNGGLVNLPPSLHHSGARYKFITPLSTPIHEMDMWQLELCFMKKKKKDYTSPSVPAWAEQLIAFGAEEGTRDISTYSLAKMYAERGFQYYNVLENLKRWNRLKNKPPLSDYQVQKCVKSGYQKGGIKIG